MKQTMKKCLTLLLALALLFTMAVPAAAAPATTYNKEITFTDVAQGDTVKAYQVMKYDANYNAYIFDTGFEKAISLNYKPKDTPFDEFYAGIDEEILKDLMVYYSAHTAGGSLAGHDALTFPAVYTEKTAGTDGTVSMTLEPGYYLFLVATKAENDKIYQPVTAFVQVKNEKVSVYAAGTEITETPRVAFKSTTGPVIKMQVKDDSLTAPAWKDTAAGKVGEEMDFYIQVTAPAYKGKATLTTLDLEDTLVGLEYVAGSVGVYATQDIATASAVSDAVTVDAGAYTAGSQKVTFKLNYNKVCDATGAVSVYVHYKAVVKAEAAVKDAVTSGSAVLKYATSVEPTKTKTTAATTATVYTYAFSLAKTSDEDKEDGTGKKPLTNAGFTLYSDAEMTAANAVSMIKETVGAETYYRPALAGETGVTDLLADMGADKNTLLVRGLDAATYYLKETKVPSGYYAPKGGFKVQLTGEREAFGEALNGKLVAASSFTAINATDNVLLGTASVNGTEMNRLDASLKNSSTPVLPTTGGVGTVMFTVVGLLCMGAALWFFLFARRRRKDEQEQG